MVTKDKIYIKLLDDGVDSWRPTFGEKIQEKIYKVLSTEDYDPNDEEWEFVPGTIVRCELHEKSLGNKTIEVLVAVHEEKNVFIEK